MSRHGRTTEMIALLPDAGAFIVVPNRDVYLEVSRMLLEQRGPEFDKLCKVVMIRYATDVEQLTGARQPIVFDHTFDTFVQHSIVEYVRAFARSSNARFMPA